MSMTWKVGNYVNKDGKNIPWMMPSDKDSSDPKQRHHGIGTRNALQILDSLTQTAEVMAAKAIAEQCRVLANGATATVAPPLPGDVKYYVAYTNGTGDLTRHPDEMNKADVLQHMLTHSNVIVCEVGARAWKKPSEAGIAPVATATTPPELPAVAPPDLPVVQPPELLPAITPPTIPETSGEDLMQRVMAKRKAS